MPTTARTSRDGYEREQTPTWISLASMFVGQRLDKRAAFCAYAAATATLAASVMILLVTRH